MKCKPSRSGARGLADELAELHTLDSIALKQRWRVLYRTEAPVHLGRARLLQAIAYRLQERILGGPKSSTRRLLERALSCAGVLNIGATIVFASAWNTTKRV